MLVPLSAGDLHHAVSVLRVRDGEQIDVVAPSGAVWRVTVAGASQAGLTAYAEELPRDPALVGAPQVTLVFGVSKGAKNDEIVQGAVEVGISRLIPVLMARSIVRFDAEKRAERGDRWRRVALSAAKQSKRMSVPGVDDPAPLADVLEELREHDVVLVAWEDAEHAGQGVRQALKVAGPLMSGARIAVVTGPEGGLAAEEIEALTGIGGRVVTLGDTILRAETAAVVLGALAVHELGGLGNLR